MSAKKNSKQQMRKLLFIDTNIWLDFYRSKNDATIALLEHVERIKDDVIVTFQLESEFKNNRQRVIAETYKTLKVESNIGRPAIFSDAQTAAMIQKNLDQAKKRVTQLKERLGKLLDNPAQHDRVYQVCQRIFHRSDSIVLTREMKDRRAIRHKARTRFLHGLPPRKQSDTSYGDAFNWEWVLLCAERESAELVIVSRDADYGLTLNDKSYINDHLRHEFSDRVSRKRGLYLFESLAKALKSHFNIAVTPQEEAAEEEIVAVTSNSASRLALDPDLPELGS